MPFAEKFPSAVSKAGFCKKSLPQYQLYLWSCSFSVLCLDLFSGVTLCLLSVLPVDLALGFGPGLILIYNDSIRFRHAKISTLYIGIGS